MELNTLPREIVSIIVRESIDSANTYRNITGVCKDWYHTGSDSGRDHMVDHSAMKHRYTNHIMMLLKRFPDRKWNYSWLSRNPNITWEYIVLNPDRKWNTVGYP